jgi:hypothetical protein
MNLKELEDKKILLFGKSRAFSMDEFASQLKFHGISIVTQAEEDLFLVVEGRMMTPYEQNESDALYKQRSASLEFVSIDALERELAKHIDANTLLMSLKLSRNKARLKSFIQNAMIEDDLFFKLLKMYTWSGEDFFENDDNRDVSAAIIGRFYKNIERNHNVQYATSGFMHLISQTSNQELIEAIASLEPLLKIKSDVNDNILLAIASHPNTPKSVLNLFIKRADPRINRAIAMRSDCEQEMQTKIYDSMDEAVLESLSKNKNLSKSVVYKLLQDEIYVKNMAENIDLDDELFNLFLQYDPTSVAKNSSLSLDMQEKLTDLGRDSVDLSLAKNSFVDSSILLKLLARGSKEVLCEIYKNSSTPKEVLEAAYEDVSNHLSLSCNTATPQEILLALASSNDSEILRDLAKNPSTPVEVLYQLQLDARFARAVKENPSFGRYIQQENIGWEV